MELVCTNIGKIEVFVSFGHNGVFFFGVIHALGTFFIGWAYFNTFAEPDDGAGMES
jgi:hypothetical protein